MLANWNEQVMDYGWYDGIAWYERKFYLPNLEEGVVYLRCEGILATSQVWVNGKALGENQCGYLPFSLRVDNLKRGKRIKSLSG